MTQELMDLYLSYNVSAVFTFLNTSNLYFKEKWFQYLENVYSYCDEDLNEDGSYNEDHLYFSFKKTSTIEDNLHKIDYKEVLFINDDFIVLKIDKYKWLSEKDWVDIKNSDYHLLSGIVYDNVLRDKTNIQRNIIKRTQDLADLFLKFYEIDIKKTNIFWSKFNFDNEVLHLSKLKDMSIMCYRKSWLYDQIDKSVLDFEKNIYKKILNSSWELETPTQISMGKGPVINIYNDLYEKCQQAMIDKYGKKQKMIDIKGKDYPLMCNLIDFTKKLKKVVMTYKLDDFSKIEKCLLNFIDKPTGAAQLKYYIEKNGESQLATDYELYEDEEVKQPEQDRNNLF